jgi:hypothetical protein
VLGLNLRHPGIEVDEGATLADLSRQAIHRCQSQQQGCVPQYAADLLARAAGISIALRVPEDPAIGESVLAEELARNLDRAGTRLAHLAADRIEAVGIVRGVLVEVGVEAEPAQAVEVMQRLPRVAGQRTAHCIAGDHRDRAHAQTPAMSSNPLKTRSESK